MPHLPSSIDLANRYFGNDFPGALIPATRLRDIRVKLDQGQQISSIARGDESHRFVIPPQKI